MEQVVRRRVGAVSRRASVCMAALLLAAQAPGVYALGGREARIPDAGIRNPSSLDLRAYAQGPFPDAPDPGRAWSLVLPGREGRDVPAIDPAARTGPVRITVGEAVEAARRGNLGLVGPRIDAEARRRADSLAWNSFLPSVDVSGTLGRSNVDQVGLGAAPRWSLSASFSTQLMLNLALFEGVRSLRADYEAGLITYAQAEARLERDVRKSFYNLLLLEENMRLMEEQIEAARRRYEQALSNYRAGVAPELTVLRAQVAWENLKPAQEDMRVGYLAARDAFAMTLGLPRGAEVVPVGQIAPVYAQLDAEVLISTGLAARLDIQSLVKAMETIQIAESALWYRLMTPSLILGWNADPSFRGDPWRDDLFADGSWTQRAGMFRATLSLRLNGLFPFTQDGQELASLRDRREGLRANLAQSLRGAEMEIEGLVRNLERSRMQRSALELNVRLAERAYRLSEEAYRAGVSDLLEVQDAELEMRRARLELLKEDHANVIGLLELEYAVGARFGTLGGSR